jgi:ribulose-5-phosphate 4-epimerase/fuculose-1-phosphate aldolase
MADRSLFDTIVVERTPPQHPRAQDILRWAATLASWGFAPSYGPGDHGNLSCRTPRGLLVSARETRKSGLQPDDLVEVVGMTPGHGRPALECRGLKLPSTDAWMHLRMYALRPDIHAILHGHDTVALAQAGSLGLPVTDQSAAMPSVELVDDACALAARHDYLVLRDHGFLALASSLDEAGKLARRIADKARQRGMAPAASSPRRSQAGLCQLAPCQSRAFVSAC